MKKTNLIILLISVLAFIAFLFFAFRDTSVSDGRKLWKAYLNYRMKDPSSLVIYGETYKKDGYKIKWTIDYGGRNGFGGMNRDIFECETFGDILFTEDGTYSKESLGL